MTVAALALLKQQCADEIGIPYIAVGRPINIPDQISG
jgi:hypothetical protein